MKTIGNIIVSSFAAFTLAGAFVARAADAAWSSGAANGDWADGGNWDSFSAPGSVGTFDSPDTASFNAPSGTLVVMPDFGRNIAGLDMSADAAFCIGAASSAGNNALTFTDGGLIGLSGAGASPFAIYSPLVLAGDLSVVNSAGNAGKVFNFSGDISGSATAGATNVLAYNGSNAGVNDFNGVISDGANGGALAFVKDGGGNAHLRANNTFSGGFTLNSGVAFVYAPNGLGSTDGTVVFNGGMLRSASNLALGDYRMVVNNDFNVHAASSTTLNLGAGSVSLMRDATISMPVNWGGTVRFDGQVSEASPGTKLSLFCNQANPGTFVFAGSNTFSGGLVLNGAGVRSFNAFALGTGPLIINAGTIGQGDGLPELAGNSAVIINGNCTFSGNGYTSSFGVIPIFVTNTAVTISVHNGNTVMRGPITADKTLTFKGVTGEWPGMIQFHCANPNLSAGLRFGTADYTSPGKSLTVRLFNEEALGPGPVEFFDSATTYGEIIIRNEIRNNAVLANDIAMIWNHGFTLYNNANSLDMGAGPVTLGSSFNSSAITVAVDNASATLTVRGVISDDANLATPSALVKNGPGTLLLGGENIYAGGTVAAAGTILVAEGGTLGAGAVTVKPGATIKLRHRHAIADAADVVLETNGTQHGKLDLDYSGIEIVRSVTFGGATYNSPGSTFGTTASGAKYVSDDYFAGHGKLIIQPEAASVLIIK